MSKQRLARQSFGLLLLASAVLASSCNDRVLTRFPIVQTFQQAEQVKIDILWVLDNSVSMEEENPLVAAGSNEFIQALVTSNADFRIGVITMNIMQQELPGIEQSGLLMAPEGIDSFLTSESSSASVVSDFNDILEFVQFDPNVGTALNGDSNVIVKGCEAGLEATRLAVDPLINRNPDFLRPDAALAIILLTDEDEATLNPNSANDVCSGDLGDGNEAIKSFPQPFSTVDEYLAYFETLKSGNYSIHGILTLENTDCPLAANDDTESTVLLEAVDATDGFKASICTADYSTFLDDLGLKIALLSSQFQLTYPADLATLEVRIDGVLLDASEYTVADDQTAILLNTPPDVGAVVEITYLVDTDGLVLLN